MKSFSVLCIFLCLTTLAFSADTFILNSDSPAALISTMINKGYGNYTVYQALLQMQADADPSVAGIISPSFLSALSNSPPDSPIFTEKLTSFPADRSLAISTNGTIKSVKICITDYTANPASSTQATRISGIGNVYFVHSGTQILSADFKAPLMKWNSGGETYNVFAIATDSLDPPPEKNTPKKETSLGGERTMGSPFSF